MDTTTESETYKIPQINKGAIVICYCSKTVTQKLMGSFNDAIDLLYSYHISLKLLIHAPATSLGTPVQLLIITNICRD